ncbi:MAG: hypothetical protein R2861_09495 [Desulfobacterales bacterium]
MDELMHRGFLQKRPEAQIGLPVLLKTTGLWSLNIVIKGMAASRQKITEHMPMNEAGFYPLITNQQAKRVFWKSDLLASTWKVAEHHGILSTKPVKE